MLSEAKGCEREQELDGIMYASDGDNLRWRQREQTGGKLSGMARERGDKARRR